MSTETLTPDAITIADKQPRSKKSTLPTNDSGAVLVSFENSPFQIHPEVKALEIPLQTSAEYQELLDNVRSLGYIIEEIKMAKDVDGVEYIVDGWHRINIADELGFVRGNQYKVKFVPYEDAVSIAVASTIRRNLSENQKVILVSNVLKHEQEVARRNQAAGGRISALIRGSASPEIIEVDYDRLKSTGDIGGTNSSDTIYVENTSGTSKIRGTFEYDGKVFVVSDGIPGQRMVAYQVVESTEYRELTGMAPINFNDVLKRLESKGDTGYDGLIVKVTYKVPGETPEDKPTSVTEVKVLMGPPVIFAPLPSGEEDPKDKKRNKKASEITADKTGYSPRMVEMLQAVEKSDPEAFNRIKRGENEPGTDRPETVTGAYRRMKAAESRVNAKVEKVDPLAKVAPNPDNYTYQEFLEGHPLYERNKDNPIFVAAINGWWHCNATMSRLGGNLNAAKHNTTAKDRFTLMVSKVANMPHCYLWQYSDNADAGNYDIDFKAAKAIIADALTAASIATKQRTAKAAKEENGEAAPVSNKPKAAKKSAKTVAAEAAEAEAAQEPEESGAVDSEPEYILEDAVMESPEGYEESMPEGGYVDDAAPEAPFSDE